MKKLTIILVTALQLSLFGRPVDFEEVMKQVREIPGVQVRESAIGKGVTITVKAPKEKTSEVQGLLGQLGQEVTGDPGRLKQEAEKFGVAINQAKKAVAENPERFVEALRTALMNFYTANIPTIQKTFENALTAIQENLPQIKSDVAKAMDQLGQMLPMAKKRVGAILNMSKMLAPMALSEVITPANIQETLEAFDERDIGGNLVRVLSLVKANTTSPDVAHFVEILHRLAVDFFEVLQGAAEKALVPKKPAVAPVAQ